MKQYLKNYAVFLVAAALVFLAITQLPSYLNTNFICH